MFHQADDIKLFLSPFDLGETSAARTLAAATTISPNKMKDLVKADLAERAETNPLTHEFMRKSGVCLDTCDDHPTLEDKLSSAMDVQDLNPDTVYHLGLMSFKNGQIADAVYAFSVLAAHPERRAPALSALASCACFQEEYRVALIFAQESIACKETHPRTYLIAGYSALKSGDKKTAKRQLALTTRLARGNANYRDEQRCAQRELLLMQLAS